MTIGTKTQHCSERRGNEQTHTASATREETLKSFNVTVFSPKIVSPDLQVQQGRKFGQDFGFVFDIDGVIYKSKIPFIFLTNGGGDPESTRALAMSEVLGGIPIHADQFIQAHTPFKQQVPELAEKAVLVLGGPGNKCREVAEGYGFKKVVTSADLITYHDGLYPFTEGHGDYLKATARPLPTTTNPDGTSAPLQIAAIFIYSSPREWGLDSQISIDLLHPLNGNPSLPNNGYLQDGQPKIYFANPDITFATKYHLGRICQGTFKLGLEAMWSGLTGTQLVSDVYYTQIGKPSQHTYEYGERAHRDFHQKDFKKFYMVGDGPRSDIAGANSYNSPFESKWDSILV